MTRPKDAELVARAHAIFSSHLATGVCPGRAELAEAIHGALRRHHGPRGCLDRVAYAYGDHPETAAPRMRWARELAASRMTRAKRCPRASRRR